jgi:hypothetical protein
MIIHVVVGKMLAWEVVIMSNCDTRNDFENKKELKVAWWLNSNSFGSFS